MYVHSDTVIIACSFLKVKSCVGRPFIIITKGKPFSKLKLISQVSGEEKLHYIQIINLLEG